MNRLRSNEKLRTLVSILGSGSAHWNLSGGHWKAVFRFWSWNGSIFDNCSLVNEVLMVLVVVLLAFVLGRVDEEDDDEEGLVLVGAPLLEVVV